MCDETNNKIANIAGDKLEQICRSCLSEVYKDYFWLEGFYQGIKLIEIYRNVTSIEINVESSLPKKLCRGCYDHLVKFYSFKSKVLESEKLLEESLVFLHENNYDGTSSPENYIINYDDFNYGKDEFKAEVENDTFVNTSNITENNKDIVCDANFNDNKINESENKDREPSKPKLRHKKRLKSHKVPKNTLKDKKKQERRKEPCKKCGKVLYAYKMDNHMRTHTKEKPYSCEKCGTCFSEKSNLNRHLKIHSNVRPFKCNRCGKGFLRPSSLAIHEMTTHNTERNVICPICSKGFKHQYFLKKHMSNIHNESSQKVKVTGPGYPCPICQNMYRTKSSLKVHRMQHEQPKAYLCNICGNRYSTKAVLINHQNVHTGEKNFTCHICQKKFRFVTTLRTHVLVHSGEKPLSCCICNKQFRQHSHLNTHIRGQHFSERPYKCSYCDKTFKQSCNLTVHTRIHTGETPYHCDICQKGFYDSSSMKKHRKGHFDKSSYPESWSKVDTE